MKTIKLSTKLLNYEGCVNNQCLINRKKLNQTNHAICISPDEVSNKLIIGGLYDKAEVFKSPLYELGEALDSEGKTDIDEIIFSGDDRKIDLKWLECNYFFDQTIESHSIFKYLTIGDSYSQKILRFENEVESLCVDDFRIKGYTLYINNYFENIEVTGIDKAKNKLFFFRAPKPNEDPADGKLVRLTEAPRFNNDGSRRDEFWSKPITLHSAAVTYVEEIELNCYESHQYKGSRLYLIGLLPKELSESDKRFFCEGIPYVDVWESSELVVKKLKDAGWGK